MTYKNLTGLLAAAMLAACSEVPATDAPAAATPPAATMDSAGPSLADIAAGAQRKPEDLARDGFRHPVETLSFFGLEPDMTVVEIWPGSGWYTRIIAPYVAQGGGTYYATGFEIGDNERARDFWESFQQSISDEAVYGTVRYTTLSPDSDGVAPAGSADMVLTFRNIHNWMNGGYAQNAFNEFYTALKPGGILGVVEHRLPADRDQDESAPSGYVSEAYVKGLAAAAGFEFVGSSEINANPLDTADHPFGVWTLPPTLRAGNYGETPDPDFDLDPYRAIGESDRMTLKFRKPE